MPAHRRLDQLLANLGYGSRSDAKRLIAQNRVAVAGKPVRDPATRVDSSLVTIDGEPLDAPEGVLVMLNKPAGYICSHDAEEGATIYDLLPEQWQHRNPVVTSIGRLDKDTTGLLLLTDHSELVHRLTSPKTKLDKTYEVELDQPASPELVPLFAAGTLLLDGETKPCLPAKLRITGERTAELTLSEGRYHQVKRMFASQGLRVLRLHRSRFGNLTLGDLPEGSWRAVEIDDIKDTAV